MIERPDSDPDIPLAASITGVLLQIQSSIPAHEGIGFLGPLEAFLASELDSLHSRRAYRRHVRAAFKLMGVSSVGLLTPEHLVLYREVLLNDGRGVATHAQALSSLRSFLNWAYDMGGLPFPPRMMERLLRVPSVDVVQPYVTLTQAEVANLIRQAARLRDVAALFVMVGAGLRVSETSDLDCSDLVQVDGAPVLWVRKGKGSKGRMVPIRDEVSEAIQRYLLDTSRLVTSEGPLFLAEDRGVDARDNPRLTHFGLRKMLHKLVLRAAIAKRITPHALRHTFGTEFQRNGRDVTRTAKVLGHKTTKPTLRYTDHLELAELRENLPQWTKASRVDPGEGD